MSTLRPNRSVGRVPSRAEAYATAREQPKTWAASMTVQVARPRRWWSVSVCLAGQTAALDGGRSVIGGAPPAVRKAIAHPPRKIPLGVLQTRSPPGPESRGARRSLELDALGRRLPPV